MNPEAMFKYTWAILNHYSCIVENPKLDNCPPGEKSWCSYQRDIASKQSLNKPVKCSLTNVIPAVINPVFQRLVSVEFLKVAKVVVPKTLTKH